VSEVPKKHKLFSIKINKLYNMAGLLAVHMI